MLSAVNFTAPTPTPTDRLVFTSCEIGRITHDLANDARTDIPGIRGIILSIVLSIASRLAFKVNIKSR